MCAKHIVASGISRVVFLEPYPKSLAAALHSDSIQIEGGDRGKFQDFPAVHFEHFFGISHRRYREMFERSDRKNKESGQFMPYKTGVPQPLIDIKYPGYESLEREILKFVRDRIEHIDGDAFFEQD